MKTLTQSTIEPRPTDALGAAPVRFRILGPVQIVGCSASPIQPRSPTRRALLTCFLLNADRYVSVKQLRELLWEDPPPSAAANLRSHLTGLRADLDRAEAGLHRRLETSDVRGGGYRVRVDPGELDLHAFIGAAKRGRAALLDRRFDAAIEVLEPAMRVWNGPFGNGLPQTQWFAAHCAGVNSVRLNACQDLYASYVLANRHELTYGIERAIADEPCRERLWEILVAAHFLDGDTASALDAVVRCRRVFAEHLGLDSPPGLLAMQRAILNWDSVEVRRLLVAATTMTRSE